MVLTAVVMILAWKNWRNSRLDWRGSMVIFGATFLLRITGGGINSSLVAAVLSLLMYLAVEPHARRFWPDSLISWTRFSQGRLRNSLVASHVLAGIVFGTIISLAALKPITSSTFILPADWANPAGSVTLYSITMAHGLFIGLGILTLVIMARMVIPSAWAATLIVSATFAIGLMYSPSQSTQEFLVMVPIATLYFSVSIWMMWRFGLLSMVTAYAFMVPTVFTPLTATGWMADRLIALHLIPVAVAVWALWVILSVRRPGESQMDAPA
jgi:hypothetical protein